MTKVIIRVSGTERISNKEAITVFLKAVRAGIVADQDEKGIRSSGESAKSLVIQDLRAGGQLVGSDYFQQQIAGRRPGKFPPIDAIMDWIDRKSIDFEGITKKSLAFVIARKIARRGTDIFQKKRSALDVRSVANEYEPALQESFVKAGRIAINTAIFKALGRKPAKQIRPA